MAAECLIKQSHIYHYEIITVEIWCAYGKRSSVNAIGATDIEKLLSEFTSEAPCGSRGKTATNQREDLRYRVLRLLETNPRMSHREIAKALGGSTGAVNYCINALIEKGMLKVSNFRSNDHKLRYAYILTPQGLDEKARLTVSFLRRKVREYYEIQSEISQILEEADIDGLEQLASDQ